GRNHFAPASGRTARSKNAGTNGTEQPEQEERDSDKTLLKCRPYVLTVRTVCAEIRRPREFRVETPRNLARCDYKAVEAVTEDEMVRRVDDERPSLVPVGDAGTKRPGAKDPLPKREIRIESRQGGADQNSCHQSAESEADECGRERPRKHEVAKRARCEP